MFNLLILKRRQSLQDIQDIIDRILAHLRKKEQDIPTLPLLTPAPRAPPETLPLFAGKESSSTAFNQQGSHWKSLARLSAFYSSV